VKVWGNRDLNQGPADYEGGRIPSYPTPSSRFDYDAKRLSLKMQLDFVGFCWEIRRVIAPPLHQDHGDKSQKTKRLHYRNKKMMGHRQKNNTFKYFLS
jgi:hypothetical protein